MRALAVTNPNATSMSPRTRDVIVRALGSELKIDVAETVGRGHAAELAAQARADGVDLVVAVGGDGTVNEVVNGLLRAGTGGDIPRFAVVPGGNANVFARALGLPTEPIEATGAVIERLRAGRERRVGLGLLEADVISGSSDVSSLRRWFTFCVGLGLDAEVVRAVERRREAGTRATPRLYLRTTLAEFARTDRRHPALTLERGAPDDASASPDSASSDSASSDSASSDSASSDSASSDSASSEAPLFFAVITNTTPWTYYGDRALEPTPEASFDAGLDLFAVRNLRVLPTAALVRKLLTGRPPRGRAVIARHDQARLKFRARRPVATQVDGEYLGECLTAALVSVPEALAVIC